MGPAPDQPLGLQILDHVITPACADQQPLGDAPERLAVAGREREVNQRGMLRNRQAVFAERLMGGGDQVLLEAQDGHEGRHAGLVGPAPFPPAPAVDQDGVGRPVEAGLLVLVMVRMEATGSPLAGHDVGNPAMMTVLHTLSGVGPAAGQVVRMRKASEAGADRRGRQNTGRGDNFGRAQPQLTGRLRRLGQGGPDGLAQLDDAVQHRLVVASGYRD